MAMGKRRAAQEILFVAAADLPRSPGHPFYERLNRLLAEAGFDPWIEGRCRPYYEEVERRGQPSLAPGVYFRMLLVGYFEGLDSQRAIAWRCSDSLSLRKFLGLALETPTPDHSTLSNTRRRLPAEIFQDVFQFVLKLANDKKLLSGQTMGVDSTTLEANAAMKSIVRRDSGEDWSAYVARLMREDGTIEPDATPTAEDIRRYDRNRKDKKVSNDEWTSPTDPDSRIAKMKDGRTRLAYKAEHVVDLESDLIVSAELCPADEADSRTLAGSLEKARENLRDAGVEEPVRQAAADKGYHSAENLALCESLGVRAYIPEPEHRNRRTWTDKPDGYQELVYNNRRRVKGDVGRGLQRLRSERVERSFAQVCDTGGRRRCWVRGLIELGKQYVLAAAAFNLGRMMRRLFGVGKPRQILEGGRAAGPRGGYASWNAGTSPRNVWKFAIAIFALLLGIATLDSRSFRPRQVA
jgi:transposase